MNSKNLDLAINTATKAGDFIKKSFGSSFSVGMKQQNPNDVVTEVDRKSEAIIIEALSDASDFSILSEESGMKVSDSSHRWVVDPLDGTKNFSRQVPLFCVSIALMRGNDPLLGVVYNPMSGECFCSEAGKGAFLNGRLIRVSERSIVEGSLIFLNRGLKAEHGNNFIEAASRFRDLCSIRYFGTTAYELCTVARGNGDCFLSSGDKLWDYAAGILLVTEAGGIVTDWNGRAWDNSTSYILASNGKLHEDIKKIVNGIQ
ncbi:inositol monophosphatase [Candidatus Woesearchaeota archaeon]|nr:inositol monophosphatase [Candidatus Woesearchaeota archaeon]